VIIDKTGTSLTGVQGTLDLGDKQFGGITLGGNVSVTYTKPATFTVQGSVSSPPIPKTTAARPLDKVGGFLNMRVGTGQILEFGLGVTGQFSFRDLTVKTVPDNPPAFEYNVVTDQFEISGGLIVSFKNNFISTTLVPGPTQASSSRTERCNN